MTRLPTPGSDNGTWGDILNDFLGVEHNPDGTLKRSSDIADAKSKADTAVQNVNGKSGASINLSASDISAVPTSQLGSNNGVAQLDSGGRLIANQIPSSLMSTSQVGVPNGVASLGANGRVPSAQLPASISDSPGLRPDGAIAESFPIWAWGNPGSGLTLTSGQLRIARFDDVVQAGTTISKIGVFAASTIPSGQTNLWFALYNAATRALLGVTVDDGTTGWQQSNTKELALTTPYTSSTDFVPVVGLLQVAAATNRLIGAGGLGLNSVPGTGLAVILSGATIGGVTPDTNLTDPSTAPNPFTAVSGNPNFTAPFYAYLK